MSLAQRLQEAREAALKPKLSPFEQWVEEREEDDRVALLAAAADPTISTRELFEIVRAEGAQVGREKFGGWRRANGYTG